MEIVFKSWKSIRCKHFENKSLQITLFEFNSVIQTDRVFLYTGELSKEEDVLEWLIENKSTGDDEEVIEDVTAKTLNTLIGNVDNLVVLFCKCGMRQTKIYKQTVKKKCCARED